MVKIKFISLFLAICLLAACTPSTQAIQTAMAETQAAWTPTPSIMPTATYTPQPTSTLTLTNTPAKSECIPVGWLNLAANLELYFGRCIYIEGRVIAQGFPTEFSNRPDDEGLMPIRPPEPNEKNLYLEVTLHGNQIFFNNLDSFINSEQGWIAIWGVFQNERSKYNPNYPRVAAGYPLEGYMLYAIGYEALSPCSVGQARTGQDVCADATPTPDPLHSSKNDGFFLVGVDIAPGIWQSSGTGNGCYWEITTKTGDIISNHYGMSGGTMYIPTTAFQVQLQNCGTWIYLGPAK